MARFDASSLDDGFLDDFNDLLRGSPGTERGVQACFLEFLGVVIGDDAASDDDDVVGALGSKELDDAGHKGHVRAGENRESNDVDVLLDGGFRDLLRRLAQAGVDDLHPMVAQRAGDDLDASVMTIEAGLGHEDPDLSRLRLCHFRSGGQTGAVHNSYVPKPGPGFDNLATLLINETGASSGCQHGPRSAGQLVQIMSKPARILLALLLVGASCLTVATAHAPPAPEVAPEPVPSRSLFIIAQEPEAYAQNHSASSQHEDDFHLALSPVANDTVEERRTYYWSDYNLGPFCTPFYCNEFYGAKGLLMNVGEDFRLAPTQDISGVLDLEYYYSENSFMGYRDPIGWIHFGLSIGHAYFEAEPIVLEQEGTYEQAVHNLTFHFTARCDYETHDEGGEHPPCDESFDNWTEEVWTHDLVLWMAVEVPQQSSLSLGRHFDMSIGTSGTSKLDLPIFVPPAPVAVAMDDNVIVSIAHDDLDADGQVAEPVAVGDDVVYVPGAGLPLLIAGTIGLAVLLRRRL